jgi:hypothetical protein
MGHVPLINGAFSPVLACSGEPFCVASSVAWLHSSTRIIAPAKEMKQLNNSYITLLGDRTL